MSALGENLQARDLEILEVLTRRVRVLSLDQIAASWWAETGQATANASRRLALLERRGLVKRSSAMAHEAPELLQPLAAWSPGEPTPELASLAYRLESRWSSPLRPTVVVTATRAAGAWLGGNGGRRPRPSEISHDLGLAALYLKLRRRDPSRAERWVPEDLFAPHELDGFVPDAILRGGARPTLIEFAGAYQKERLERLHHSCLRAGLPYELW